MKHTILVADDERHILKLVQIPLRSLGYEVILANDGEEAWRKMQEHIPSLVISDVMMPGKNGFEVLVLARNNPQTRTIPFIFLTARTTVRDKVKSFELGADDYITKPFHLDELIARVNKVLQRIESATLLSQESDKFSDFSGDLESMPLGDILQIMELGQKTGSVHIKNKTNIGVLFLKQGKIIHAIQDNLKGEDAAYRMLRWKQGQFSFKEGSIDVDSTIMDSPKALVLESMRQYDEINRIKQKLGPENWIIRINKDSLALKDVPDQYQKILMLIDEQRSIKEISQICPFNQLDLFKGLEYLLSEDILQIS